MANFNPVLDTINRSRQLSDQFYTNKDKRMSELKSSLGYDDRLKSIDTTRRAIMDAESLIGSLGDNVRQRTAGRLMNAAQLARLQAREGQKLSQNVSNLARALDVNQRGLADVKDTLARESEDLWRAYSARARELNDERQTFFQKYLSDLDTERQAAARAIQERIAQINAAAQQRAAEAQLKMLELQQRYADQQNAIAEQKALAQQQLAEKQRKENLKKQLKADAANVAIVNPTTPTLLDDLNRGINTLLYGHDPWEKFLNKVGGQSVYQKQKAEQQEAANLKKALNFLSDNYDLGPGGIENKITSSMEPFNKVLNRIPLVGQSLSGAVSEAAKRQSQTYLDLLNQYL